MNTEAAVPIEAQLNQMERVEPPVEKPPEPPPDAPLNLDDEAAVDAALEANAIQVPDGDKLVPSSDVGKVARHYRTELKETRAKLAEAERGSAEAATLRQQVQQLAQQVQQLTPYVQAYQAAQQAPPQVVDERATISDEQAATYAKRYDLYKADGSGALDLDRGRDILLDMKKIARDAAKEETQAQVAPIHQMTEAQLSRHNFLRAMATQLPNGARPSEAALKEAWDRLPRQLTATVDGAKEAFQWALGRTYALGTPQDLAALHQQAPSQPQRGANGQFLPKAPEPVPRETSGGKDVQGQSPLSESEKKYLAATGMSEADYLKAAAPRYGK